MSESTGCLGGPVADLTPVDLARRVVDGLPVSVAAHQEIAAELVRLHEALDVAVERALAAALGEVRRQGGSDYLLREARTEGLAAASLALRHFRDAPAADSFATIRPHLPALRSLRLAASDRVEEHERLHGVNASGRHLRADLRALDAVLAVFGEGALDKLGRLRR